MSGTTGTVPLQTVVADQLITAALWNAEFGNVSTLMDAAGCGGHSGTDAETQIQTAPYPGSVLSKATSIAGEIERIRNQLAAILGTDYWYKPAATDLTSVGNVVVPVGGILDFPIATPPSSQWHLADGTAISRAAYPSLFTLIGTTFGVGNGTTTFNLPDYRDRMSIGAGTTYAAAATGGASTHTLTKAEIPTGLHTLTDPNHTHSITDPNHSHGVTDPGHVHSISGKSSGAGTTVAMTLSATNQSQNTGSNTTGVTVNSGSTGITGANSASSGVSLNDLAGGTSHSILNPYLSMYKLIRVL